MEDNDNLDRFLERMAQRKQKMSQGNKNKYQQNSNNRINDPEKSQNQPNQKPKKTYIDKATLQKEPQKKYIAKDSLVKNQPSKPELIQKNAEIFREPETFNKTFRVGQNYEPHKSHKNLWEDTRLLEVKPEKTRPIIGEKKEEYPKIYQKTYFNKKPHFEQNEYEKLQRPEKNKKREIKTEYKNQCEKYTKNCQKLLEREQELGIEIKKLKKFFLESDFIRISPVKPTEISVMKCLDSPVIFFEYNYEGEKRYMALREVCKGLADKRKLGDYYEIVKKIYDTHYFPVDLAYQKALLQFVKLKAADIQLKLALNKKTDVQNPRKQTEKMFYYWLNQYNYIQFIFFDYMMRGISFAEKYINQKRNDVDEETFRTFERFSQHVKAKDELEMVNFGEEEVESQHSGDSSENEEENFDIFKKCFTLKHRLDELISTDISEIQTDLEAKNKEQLDLLINDSTQTEKIEKLGDDIDRINTIVQNFNLVKEQIQHQLKRIKLKREYTSKDLQFFTLSLKRMIFAKKQLDSDLPILGKKKEIFDLLDKNNLIILEGETGSGKSTQLPQMLCEYYKLFENPKALPVLVTQPRKIATRSLAERVADELEERGGTFVDYVASGTKVANPKAKIIFKLDRLVLDELVESPTLDAYSCLVIDEAHERTISIDVILGLVKELLKKRDGFKVIITSASMEISLFERYFKMKTLKVSGRMYPVNIKYLPSKEEDMVKRIEKAIDSELLTERNMLKDKYKGHILVFCADTAEIEALSEIFRKKLNHNVFMVIPLHGKLTPEDQKKAFSKTKEHKLIFASRIAETAITIDGVKVVIDPGWDREMQYDQKTKFSSMKLAQISQSSAKQRAGRAGRTQEGYCLRLYSEEEFNRRRFNKLPEIKNIALETLVLRLKTLGINNVSSFDYIERPDEEGMKTSIETLKMIGCLDGKEIITSIGRFLVKIPIEPFLARAIIEGLLMEEAIVKYKIKTLKASNLTQSIIQILCMVLNAGNLFRIQENFRQLAEKMKYEEFSHEKGDFFFLKNIYDQFTVIDYHDRRQLNQWLQSHFLIKKTLIQVKDLVREIQSILKQFRIDEREMKVDLLKCKKKLEQYQSEEDRILSCLTTSFAANLCLFSGHAQIGYTYMSMEKLVTIYGTSSLSLLGICPKWILAYDFYENKDGKLYCKVAHEIDCEFMRNTVEDYVYEKYRIDKLEKNNPFYKSVSYSLETLIMLQLKEYYETREYRTEKQLQFLKPLNLSFSEVENKVTAFIKCDQSEEQNKQLIETQLQRLIDEIKKKAMSPYNHNYIGNIFVLMGNGFDIMKIDFKSTQTVFEVSGLDEETFNAINNDWTSVTYTETFGKNKIKLYFDNEEFIASFNSYLDYCKDKEGKKLIVRTQIADIRKKVPQTKIYLHWFAGLSQQSNILVKFAFEVDRSNSTVLTEKEVIQITSKQCEYLSIAKQKLNLKKKRSQRRQRLIRYHMIDPQMNLNETFTEAESKLYSQSLHLVHRLTKSGNGVNVYGDNMDQIDLYRYYAGLISTNNINPHFQLPKFIKKFRDPERPYCEMKDAEWIEQIQKMLEKVTDKNEPCIRVWGTGIRKNENQKLSELEKTWRIEMKAEIKTFDCNLLARLKQKFDGKLEVLGCQKLHVSSLFSQSVIAVGLRAFEYLKQEFDYNIDNFRQQFPGLIVDIFVRQVRKNSKKSKVFITISSENRQHLLKPVRILNSLFTPKYITLLDSEFRYLNNHEGDELLEEMEATFDYKIHFGFDKTQRRLKLYCHDSLQNDIKNALKKKLSEITYHDEIISYKGKNLKKIEKFLQEKQQQIDQNNRISHQQKFLAYEIRFTSRNVKVMADLETFYTIKRELMNLKVEEKDNKCPVCQEQMLTPYKLFNCGHTFCWSCLENVVKEFKAGHITHLKCPHYDENETPCNKFINIYDVMKILSEQELQQIFDVKISKYVDEHLDKYERCLSADCEQIFEKETLKNDGEIDCRLCGKYYCLKCKESHKNFTCEEWKSRYELTNNLMEKIGIKQCPKCKNGIQKNGGCKHISCKCGAHICWECLKMFLTSQQCYDHLTKEHKGIFGPDYVEN